MPSDEAPKPDYVDAECMRGADLVDAGKLPEAAEVFRALCSHPKIADGLRAIMAVNLAVVYDKMGHPDTAAQTYEYAASLVLPPYLFAEESRAAYLFKIGKRQEAAEIWNSLLGLTLLPEDVRARIEHNLATAR